VTQKLEKDIDQARITIEFLRMLQEKTEGNLTPKEQELIDNTVADLELNFADEVRLSEQKEGALREPRAPVRVLRSLSLRSFQRPDIIKPN